MRASVRDFAWDELSAESFMTWLTMDCDSLAATSLDAFFVAPLKPARLFKKPPTS